MFKKNIAITISSKADAQDIKKLLYLNNKWILVIKKDGSILGSLDEKTFLRRINICNQKSLFEITDYLNKNFKIYSDIKNIYKNDIIDCDFIILNNEYGYECFFREEIISIKLQNKLDYQVSINKEITHENEILNHHNDELKQILNSTYDEVFVTDATGNVLFVSESSRRLTGLPPNSFVGRNIKELNKKGIIDNSGTLKAMETKKVETVQQEYPNGVTVLATSQPIFNKKGELYRTITNSRDITELVKMKKKINELTKESVEKMQKKLSVFYYKGLITVDDNFLTKIDTAKRVASLDSSVLIEGETGVGKGLIANLIHDLSTRNKEKFVQINCGAIHPSLIESELFGYEPGSFTGAAKKGKKGLVEIASGGTLFLDEIGEMPLDLQVKFLHLLQEKRFMRLGGTKEIKANIRIISATNKKLKKLIKENKFREDLYYRIHVIPLHLPPLRERKEDVLLLINYFLYKYNKIHKKNITLDNESKLILKSYSFPGNVRELENLVEQIIVTSFDNFVSAENLSMFFHNEEKNDLNFNQLSTLKQAVDKAEEKALKQALKKYATTRDLAQELDVSQTTIIRKLKKFNLSTS